MEKVYVLGSSGGHYSDAWEETHGVYRSVGGAEKAAALILERGNAKGGDSWENHFTGDLGDWHRQDTLGEEPSEVYEAVVASDGYDCVSSFTITAFELQP